MANIDITDQGGGSLSNGVLQLENGVAMDTTLRYVADQANTKSQLLLATNATTVEGTLKVKTNNVEYLDVEDGSGNNRFTISRPALGQKVTLDFASNPVGSTTIVGSIRTFTDGANLNDIVQFREDGQTTISEGLNLGGSKLTNFSADQNSGGALTITSANAATYNGTVYNVTGAVTISADNTVPDGFSLTIIQQDANQCTITAGTGLTRRNRQGHTQSAGQWAVISIVRTGSNLILGGDTA